MYTIRIFGETLTALIHPYNLQLYLLIIRGVKYNVPRAASVSFILIGLIRYKYIATTLNYHIPQA